MSPLHRRPPLTLLLVLLSLALTTIAAAPPSRPATGVPKPADPNRPVPGKFTHPKLKGWINDVPDTGQFLADSVWLLRVGPRVTTVGEYVATWFSSYPEFRPGQDSLGRVRFLKNLMNRDVLGLTALGQDRPLRFEDRLALRETRQRALAGAVYQRLVTDSVKVSESEIRQAWETFKSDHRFRHILLSDRNAAERVRRELVTGKLTWSAAVRKYSIAKNDRGPDGDLGWGLRNQIEPRIAHRIYALKPGEISTPVQDREGWHLVQSVEQKRADPPAFNALRGSIKRFLESEKSLEISERLLARLRAEVGMTYDTANVVFAAKNFSESMSVKQEPLGATFEINGAVPEFAPQDTSRVLARWNGGSYSLGSLLEAFEHIPPVLRPTLNMPDAMIAFVETTVLEPNIAEFGARLGLEKDPLVVEPVEKKREEILVEQMYQDSIASRIWVSKQDRREYYDKNLPQFFTYPSVRFAAIVRASKAGTDSVERALRAGVRAEALLAADSAAGLVSGSIQSRHQKEEGPYHKALFEEMRPGDIQVRGPDRSGDYVILQLLSYDGGRQLSFEEGDELIVESLQNQKMEQALEAMIDRLRKRYEIAMRPELVMLIKLVDPTLD